MVLLVGFKASSIDTTKPATIEIKKGAEANQVTAEYPSTQVGVDCLKYFSFSNRRIRQEKCIFLQGKSSEPRRLNAS